MKIKPIWGDCKDCKGVGTIDVEVQKTAGATETQPNPCPKCNGSGKVRTDDLHRKLKLREGDALYDVTIPAVDDSADIICFNHPDKTCGALCAAFDVRTEPTGKIHYACCAGMPNHVIGVIDVE